MGEKLIGYSIFDPRNSVFGAKNEKAKATKTYCSNSGNCFFHEKGQCVLWSGLAGHKCKFGRKEVIHGYTQRATKYHDWINKRKKESEGVGPLKAAPQKMGKIGSKIYFPYPHWYMILNLPEEIQGNAWKNIYWIPENLFNADLLIQIIEGKPHAMMGGEIKSYQKEIVPKIVLHLKEIFPGIWENLIQKKPCLGERSKELSHIGRKAILSTLIPGCEFEIERKGTWKWDGEFLTCENYEGFFLPVKGPATIKIKPEDGASVIVTNEVMTNHHTEFID